MRVEERAVLVVNVRHPTVTSGLFVVQLFSAVSGGDAALPKLLWDFLLTVLLDIASNITIQPKRHARAVSHFALFCRLRRH